jgi:hypothetical protein
MFDLGASLRAARHKRGLELDVVQRELRIRRRYLEALETERFELLPGEVYARGFLREYAEFLGLDGSIYVEEYNARFAHHDEPAIAAHPTASPIHRAPAVPLVLAVIAAIVLAVGLAAWQLGGRGATHRPTAQAAPAPAVTVQRPLVRPKPGPAVAPVAAQPPRLAHLVLRATRGDCWVIARAGSASGPVLYQNTLLHGRTLALPLRGKLWLRVGLGANLDARVDGRGVHGLPAVTGNLLVSA